MRRDLELCSRQGEKRPDRESCSARRRRYLDLDGLDADNKLILSWIVGNRDAEYALALMDDVRQRLANRVQLTTDGHAAYLSAVEEAFGADIDYSMLIKLYGAPSASPEAARRYSPSECVGTRKR